MNEIEVKPMETLFQSVEELVERAEARKSSISATMIAVEQETTGQSYEEIMQRMERNLQTMEAAVAKGIAGVRSYSGLTGNDAKRLDAHLRAKKNILDETFVKAITYAIATNEVNAAMGLICATPTAGSAGVVPGVVLAFAEKLAASRQDILNALFTAAAFGIVTANNAFISGAEGGCQAEIGSAAGMGAAALVELAGGSPREAANAFAIALKNTIGLACDPVAGLVEIPCIKRNASGSSIAMSAAEMALAGIESNIPADEVIEAMYRVGKSMSPDIRETGVGGLAGTRTGKKIAKQLFVREQ
jgi:L-serine dehydratase